MFWATNWPGEKGADFFLWVLGCFFEMGLDLAATSLPKNPKRSQKISKHPKRSQNIPKRP
jgi:hypothetical protein